jgi:uncharacterized membrane protein required for colicin V production
MTEKIKNRIMGSLFGTVSGITVGLVVLFWGNKINASQDFESLVESKADKTELKKIEIELKQTLQNTRSSNS